MRGVYVHVPFCTRKCGYCSFHSITGADDDLKRRVVDRIVSHAREVKRRFGATGWETLYIGGGTPSVLPPGELTRLVHELLSIFGSFREMSCEANPESGDDGFLDEAHEAGITRLSIGVQSLEAACLEPVGRLATNLERISLIRRQWRGELSVDLICGLPGQTANHLRRDIESLAALPVEHLSLYDLTVEPDTPLKHDLDAGRVELPACDVLWEVALDVIARTRLQRYEVSNFAIPGNECRHNVGYWHSQQYVGLGPSACSTLRNGTRRFRITQPSETSSFLSGGFFEHACVEEIDHSTQVKEYLMVGLRLPEGISLNRFRSLFGPPLPDLVPETIRRHVESDLLWCDGDRLGPTDRGLDLLNIVLLDALCEVDRRLTSLSTESLAEVQS